MKKKWIIVYCLIISAFLILIKAGSQAVTVMAENAPIERSACIIIDPGHGGVDGGATSCTGKLESSFNLEMALRLNDLMHLLGYETKMIRTEDISIYTQGNSIAQKKVSDLKERVRIVNETENALLVSIHQNIFPDSRYSGAQVFYAETEGSRELANLLQSTFGEALGSRRECKKSDGIYLMEHIEQTGILVECGFLSNAQEEALLRSKEYQQQICCVIAATVSRFLSNT